MNAGKWVRAASFALAILIAEACASGQVRAPDSGGPGWAAQGDRTDEEGSTFVCQGEGATEEEALTAAHGICNDKVCRVCGVEVESVVQTTETLDGVSMQRKVVERCRQFRKAPLTALHKSTDCGPKGCSAWLEVHFSKADEKAECSAYASEHFADSGECERLIEEFRNTEGRTAATLRNRQRLLEAALGACADIDVRPTPLLDALQEKLLVGMNVFEFTPEKQQARVEERFFDTTWYKSREEMMERRGAVDFYLTTPGSLRQKFRETKTLLGRIQLVRDYVHNRALVFDVMEATEADDLDSPAGIRRLLAALQAAPIGVQYESDDVHFYGLYTLGKVRTDIEPLNEFFRKNYPAQTQYWNHGIPLGVMFAKDRQVDVADWDYIFELHRAHPCPVCVQQLLDVADHGGARLRDERFFAALNLDLKRARDERDRKRCVTDLLPSDTQFALHVRPLLPLELQAALDWDFVVRRLDQADDDDDLILARNLLPLLVATLVPAPGSSVPQGYCIGLADKLEVLAKRNVSLEPLAEAICACLTGPLGAEGTRVLVNKSDLYDYALAYKLACVRPT